MIITFERARTTLIIIFGAGLLIQLMIVSLAFFRGAIYSEHLQSLFVKLIGIYSIPFGIIIAGIFGQRKERRLNVPVTAFWLAVVLSGIWNLLLVGRSMVFGFSKEDQVQDLLSYFDQITASSSFLIASSLAYFFVVKKQTEKGR